LDIPKINSITGQIVDAAIKVHTLIGPGLLESAYRACLAHELRRRGLRVECEVDLPIFYDGLTIDLAYRIDMCVEEAVLVDTKAIGAVCG
jgi:GxxExxY protein